VPTGATSLLPADFVVAALEHQAVPSISKLGFCSWAYARTAHVLDMDRAPHRVYASGWATTGARDVLAATMADVYATADAILADHFGDGSGTEVVPVQHGAHTEDVLAFEDVDLEGVPREAERTVKDRRVSLDGRWKKVNAEETLPR
jgi:adrenodoxin-NADP+ reductase